MYKAALEREVKQAREDEARNALFAEKALAEKSRENVRKANSSALEKARNSSVTKSGSAADFYKNRSETMGRGVIGDLENLEKIKNRDLGAELKLEGQKLKYQWEEAGRRYDALSEEEKRARYRKYYSSPLDRVRMSREEGRLGGRSAQETRNRISNDIYERYKKLDEESRDPAKAEKYAFINRLRSAAGEGVENLGLWLYETFGYEPGKETYDRGEARAIGEVANEQVQRLVDAAPSQLGRPEALRRRKRRQGILPGERTPRAWHPAAPRTNTFSAEPRDRESLKLPFEPWAPALYPISPKAWAVSAEAKAR